MSRALFALRERAGRTQAEVAAAAGINQNDVSRAEHARAIPDPDSRLPRLLDVLNATPDERARILAMARAAQPADVPARTILERGTAHFQARIRDIEDQAERVRSFHPAVVLGVLQTEAYASAVFKDLDDGEERLQSVAERIARGRALLDGSDREWVLLQTEGALRWNFAGAEAMAEQMDQIAAVAHANEHVRLGIIPLMQPARGMLPLHGFHIYNFAGRRYRRDPLMAQVGTHSGTALLGEVGANQYVPLFAQLEQIAVFGHQADELLERIAADYRSL